MRKALYRQEPSIVFGVCQGLANHFDLSVFWLRIGLLVLAPLTGIFPVVIGYGVAALLMKPAGIELDSEETESGSFYTPQASSGSLHLKHLKERFDAIDQRIRRMESHVTNKSYDWERRFLNEERRTKS